MGQYLAAVFTDLEKHSLAWAKTPRDNMVALIAEYRYLAESLASQFGNSHQNFTGDGHLFLFETADAAIQFGLKLIGAWTQANRNLPGLEDMPHMPLRLGCHFGECTQLADSDDWIGRAINMAKRVEDAAEPDTLYVTDIVLELVDVPLYQLQEAGSHALKGDHLPRRTLYQITGLDEAAQAARPAEEIGAEGWFLKGVGLIGTAQENSRDEESFYRHALKLRSDYPEAHNNLAILLRNNGDLTGAAQSYREALRLRPGHPEAHYNYAILLEARGSIGGAIDHFREALKLRPEYVDARHSFANLLKARGELQEAENHYQEVLRLRPGYPEAHSNFAILLELLGRFTEAGEHYEEALRLNPNYKEGHYNYAMLLESKQDAVRAQEHYRQALRVWPEFAEAHNNLAVLLHLQGDLNQAEAHYRKALRLRPDDPETHYNLGLVLRSKGDETADEHFRTASELAPEVAAFKSAIEPPS
jgi:tetratricopeptide (TPR) repeat protein